MRTFTPFRARRRVPRAALLLSLVGGVACGGRAEPSPLPAPAAVTGAGAPGEDGAAAGVAMPGVVPNGPRRISPLDLLAVTVLDAPEFTREVRVTETGEISLPLLGMQRAAGLTPHELELTLSDTLRGSYMVDPQVTVHVKEAAAEPIYVVGEVHQPGAFSGSGGRPLTLLQAVALAEGLKPAASQRGIFVIRTGADGSRWQIPIHLKDVVNGRAPDLLLEPNDVVYVPTNMERSVALGVVNALVRVVTFRAVF